MNSILVFVCCVAQIAHISSYSTGAPNQACATMDPGHGSNFQKILKTPADYQVKSTISPDQTHVTLVLEGVGGKQFKGFLMKVTREGSNESIGEFDSVSNGKLDSCKNNQIMDLATHTSSNLKSSVSTIWKPPVDGLDFVVRVTVVEAYSTVHYVLGYINFP